ncbi:MAG: metallophosphoesterase family protein [Caulobacteraceae bacterium]
MPSLTYAIGDLHGRLDLLRAAQAAIAAHAGLARHQVICLGDYVDRGPDSKGVVEALMARAAESVWVCLKGNHEDLMIEAFRAERRGGLERWAANVGDETLISYGGQVPTAHLDWLGALPLFHRDAHRLFVHAGVKPNRPLEDQDPYTLMWIREPFLSAPATALPCHVVHGHTPRWRGKPDLARPELLPHRTNLDTGAAWTGILSVGVFEDGRAGGPVEVLSILEE